MGNCLSVPAAQPSAGASPPSPSLDQIRDEIRNAIHDELKTLDNGSSGPSSSSSSSAAAVALPAGVVVNSNNNRNAVSSAIPSSPTVTSPSSATGVVARSSPPSIRAPAVISPSLLSQVAPSSGLFLDAAHVNAVFSANRNQPKTRIVIQGTEVIPEDPHNPITFAPAITSSGLAAGIIPRITGISDEVGDSSGYTWSYYTDVKYKAVPGYCETPPFSERFDISKLLHVGVDAIQSGVDLLIKHFKIDDFDRWLHPQRYVDFFQFQVDRNTMSGHYLDALISLPLPDVSHSWQHDIVWASQFLSGTNPVMVRLVTEAVRNPNPNAPPLQAGPLPTDFLLTDAVKAKINDITTTSIEELVTERRLFVIDYATLKGCPFVAGRVLYAPIALFYVDTKGTFLPLCIQLRRDGNDAANVAALTASGAPEAAKTDRTIYYPTDTNNVVWTLAKMLVGHADGNYHEAITHLGFTHLLMEPIAIAANRVFRADHPIYKFLAPHFNRTLWINDKARSSLINPNKAANANLESFTSMGLDGTMYLLNAVYENFNFMRDTHLLDQLRYRGVLDSHIIPTGYFYRDFGSWLWQCMHDYVSNVVDAAYNDEKTASPSTDKTLAEFLDEVSTKGKIKGFPTIVPSDYQAAKSFLSDLLTCILWTGSAQHAAVNFPQYDLYAFLPAKPLWMTYPMPPTPAQNQLVTWPYVTKALAGMSTTLESILIAKTLTSQWTGDIHLETERDHPKLSWFKLDTVAFPKEYQSFVLQLKTVEDQMRNFNNENGSNYQYLYPSQVPASVSI